LDARTKRRILRALEKGEEIQTKIMGHPYVISYVPEFEHITATPLPPRCGDTATNAIPWDDYRYTHGGQIYRQAVEWCHELYDEFVKRRAGLLARDEASLRTVKEE